MATASDDAHPVEGVEARRWRSRRWGALGLVVATSAAVWLVVPSPAGGGDAPPAAAPAPVASTTTIAVTVYGCPLTDVGEGAGGDADEGGASGELAADPDCTDASVVAEYCGVPRSSIATPGTEQASPVGLTRTYETAAGLPAGSLTHLDDASAGVAITLQCESGRSFDFTSADAESFTRPA